MIVVVVVFVALSEIINFTDLSWLIISLNTVQNRLTLKYRTTHIKSKSFFLVSRSFSGEKTSLELKRRNFQFDKFSHNRKSNNNQKNRSLFWKGKKRNETSHKIHRKKRQNESNKVEIFDRSTSNEEWRRASRFERADSPRMEGVLDARSDDAQSYRFVHARTVFAYEAIADRALVVSWNNSNALSVLAHATLENSSHSVSLRWTRAYLSLDEGWFHLLIRVLLDNSARVLPCFGYLLLIEAQHAELEARHRRTHCACALQLCCAYTRWMVLENLPQETIVPERRDSHVDICRTALRDHLLAYVL